MPIWSLLGERRLGKEFALVFCDMGSCSALISEVSRVKILVADDSPTMRRIVVQMLKRLGYMDIAEADHGKDALDRLKADGNFDLLLTDWNMPIMNGLELVQSIRSDPALGKLPILMVTTRNQKQDIVIAMRAGVNNYATKPFDPKTIKEKIYKVIAASAANV